MPCRAVGVAVDRDGQALVTVERFALITNNLTYAVLGDELGYWQLFPAAPGWGRSRVGARRGHALEARADRCRRPRPRAAIDVDPRRDDSSGRAKGLVPGHGAPSRRPVARLQRNLAFVDGLEVYDSVVGYDDVHDLDDRTTTVIDVAGDHAIANALSEILGDRLRRYVGAGFTHRAHARDDAGDHGLATLFFAPDEVIARTRQWGRGESRNASRPRSTASPRGRPDGSVW